MERLTDGDWAKAVTYLDEKAAAVARANGDPVAPRTTTPTGPTPIEERRDAMKRAREARG